MISWYFPFLHKCIVIDDTIQVRKLCCNYSPAWTFWNKAQLQLLLPLTGTVELQRILASVVKSFCNPPCKENLLWPIFNFRDNVSLVWFCFLALWKGLLWETMEFCPVFPHKHSSLFLQFVHPNFGGQNGSSNHPEH